MLRGALIGAGNIALNGHLPAYLDDPWLQEKVEIVAAADLSETNLAVLRTHLPLLRIYCSAEKLLQAEHLDFVDVCAPPYAHVEIIHEAVQQGCHILCEKPLAARLTEGLAIQSLVAEQPLVFMPCHQYRFSPLWRTVQQLIRAEEIGEVHFAQFEIFRLHADSGNGHWQASWRTDPRMSGGGIVFDIGTHYFYLIFSFFGLPQQITARTAQLRHADYKVEDTALILFEYPNRLVELTLTWAADHRENRARLIGTKGNIELRGDTITLQQGETQHEWRLEGASSKAAYAQWYSRLFHEFVDNIETARYSPASLEEALNALRCAELCYRSAQTGKTYRFTEDLPVN